MRFALAASTKGKFIFGTLIGILSWAVVLLCYVYQIIEPLELKIYDALCRFHAHRSPAPDEVVLAVVDQGSIDAAARQGINWPWPRQMYSPIVEYCISSGAKAVAFDVIFTEPSVYGVEDDKILAQALKSSGHVFLPLILTSQNRGTYPWEDKLVKRAALPLQDRSGQPHSSYLASIPPIQMLADSAAGLGNVAISSEDADGIYRRIPPLFFYQGNWLPSLGFSVFRHLTGGKPFILDKEGIQVNSDQIPLDGHGTFLLHYYDPSRDFSRFSAFNVIQSFQAMQEKMKPIYPPQVFKNKVVFIGFTAAGLYDLKPTPVSPMSPGVIAHVTLLANLLHKDFRVRISPAIILGLAAAVAIGMGIIVMLVPSLWKLTAITLILTGGALLFVLLSFQNNLWVDGVFLGASMGLSFAMSTAFSYATEGRQRREIKQMFSHYMSGLLIQDLLKNPGKLRLGGEKKVLTVFFSDLAGFTALSEKLAPGEVVSLLNKYLTAMTDIILASGGLIDKYEGDAIMAFWGAPVPQEDHAARACLAALDNQARLGELREEFVRAGLPPLYSRIGINTGEMIIGNMGSTQRFDFTVIGDSVNLASRLEGAGKEYGIRILISENTYLQAADLLEVRELDLLRVKGKNKPVRIYELLARKGQLGENLQRGRELFLEGLNLYRKQKWMEARGYFQQVLAFLPDDGPAHTFIRRCEEFQQAPPGEDWDGVFRLANK